MSAAMWLSPGPRPFPTECGVEYIPNMTSCKVEAQISHSYLQKSIEARFRFVRLIQEWR